MARADFDGWVGEGLGTLARLYYPCGDQCGKTLGVLRGETEEYEQKEETMKFNEWGYEAEWVEVPWEDSAPSFQEVSDVWNENGGFADWD